MSHDNDKPIDPDISDLYQSTRTEGPGAALDAAILAEAREAVEPRRKRPAWIAPVGLAATLLIGVNLAVNLKDYSTAPDIYSESAAPAVRSGDELDAEQLNRNRSFAKRVPNEAADAPQGKSESAPGVQDDETDSSDFAAAPRDRVTKSIPTQRPDMDAGNYYIESRSASEVERSADQNAQTESKPVAPASVLPEAREDSFRRQTAQVEPRPAAAQAPVPASEPSPPADADTAPKPVIVTMPVRAPETIDEPSMMLNALPNTAAADPERQDESAESDTVGSDLEEVLVTGSVASREEDSPHRRLSAKDQAIRNKAGSNAASFAASGASDSQAGETPVYVCDPDALKIDDAAIESAKIYARTAEPPLTAASWPVFIREAAGNGDYLLACVHLAAYRDLFPDAVLIHPLPVTLAPDP